MTTSSSPETLEQAIERLADLVSILKVGDHHIASGMFEYRCVYCPREILRSVARLTLERAVKVCRNEARSCGAMMKSCHFQDACAIEKLAEEELKV